MDYGELKEKYGESVNTARNDRLVRAALAIVALAIAAPVLYLFYQSYYSSAAAGAYESTLKQIIAAGAANDSTTLVETEFCSSIEKSESEWVISGCKDNITIYIAIRQGKARAMRVCGGWDDGREAAEKAGKVLNILGIDTSCDTSSVSFVREEDGADVYNICGSSVYMSNGCIV